MPNTFILSSHLPTKPRSRRRFPPCPYPYPSSPPSSPQKCAITPLSPISSAAATPPPPMPSYRCSTPSPPSTFPVATTTPLAHSRAPRTSSSPPSPATFPPHGPQPTPRSRRHRGQPVATLSTRTMVRARAERLQSTMTTAMPAAAQTLH